MAQIIKHKIMLMNKQSHGEYLHSSTKFTQEQVTKAWLHVHQFNMCLCVCVCENRAA